MSNSTPPKRHRGPGRPKGSKDVRPLLIGLLQKYRLYPVLMSEFEAAKKEMTAKERLMFSLELAKLGIAASPRTMDLEGNTTISLVINGIHQTRAIDGAATPRELDVTPARALAPADDSWRDRMPHSAGEACAELRDRPLPHRPLQEEEPPVRGPVFVVPSFEGDRTPAEWRQNLYEED